MSELRFPLNDVKITLASTIKRVTNPIFSDSYCQINMQEFALQVESVGSFYACNGEEIEYTPADGAGKNEIELYLNGSVYGAILHQRMLLPLHGSSFRHNGLTVLVCGDTGAGKSSVTASFCLAGAEFLTDDVTPLVLIEGVPYILALSDRIKLWADTLSQLQQAAEGLLSIYKRTDKFYLPMERAEGDFFRPDVVILIEIKESGSIDFNEVSGTERFTVLRGEIYRPDYLRGMPENEPTYFSSLITMASKTSMIRVRRPVNILISELHNSILQYLAGYGPEKS
ncbi:MAG: hypothetical protein GT597_14285 [Bacteroidales bacterium]|nr:hypothetical protein [Bacteroidales bacterium]